MHGVTLLLRNPVQMYLSSVFLMHMHVHAYPSLFKKFCDILISIFSNCWVVSLIFNQIGIWIWGIKLVILGTSLDNAPPYEGFYGEPYRLFFNKIKLPLTAY